MSIGVATGPADDIGLTDLLERADQALYAAKNGGRNRVEVADDLPAEPDPLPEAARA
jgi:PleD family two-component response regulator